MSALIIDSEIDNLYTVMYIHTCQLIFFKLQWTPFTLGTSQSVLIRGVASICTIPWGHFEVA